MENTDKSLLIIFYRNPRLGFVKTRLAATVGDEKALKIYQALAMHTREVTQQLPVDRVVYYSDLIERDDIWADGGYHKALQKGNDLGEKMKNAFAASFKQGYDSVCIIGTDCYELTAENLRQAYAALRIAHTVIGPARDGGYYLIGMHKLHPEIFENKDWSTSNVLSETIADLDSLGLRFVKLVTLRDVDTEDDLPETLK